MAETKKVKSTKKADLELRLFSVEMAVQLGANYSIAKVDEIYKYLKTGIVVKSAIITKK
jgi:hypothetical protein